jgi:hypothetical protein
MSCAEKYSPAIEAVLKQAGKNRSESEYYDAPWNDVATVLLRWTSSSDKQSVIDAYGLGELVVQYDVKYIRGMQRWVKDIHKE